jgi:hypothetical protein
VLLAGVRGGEDGATDELVENPRLDVVADFDPSVARWCFAEVDARLRAEADEGVPLAGVGGDGLPDLMPSRVDMERITVGFCSDVVGWPAGMT